MKKLLLLIVAVVTTTFSASAFGTPYWFTCNAQVEAQPTGAGKVYCSFTSTDDAISTQATFATKHYNKTVTNGVFSDAYSSLIVYAEPNEGYQFVGYLLNGEEADVQTAGDDVYINIPPTQENTVCGAGSLSEEECIAQHTEKVASHLDATITAVFEASTPTAVTEVKTTQVKSVKYYNLQGVAKETPFDGVNIIVETLVDGTKKARKQTF